MPRRPSGAHDKVPRSSPGRRMPVFAVGGVLLAAAFAYLIVEVSRSPRTPEQAPVATPARRAVGRQVAVADSQLSSAVLPPWAATAENTPELPPGYTPAYLVEIAAPAPDAPQAPAPLAAAPPRFADLEVTR